MLKNEFIEMQRQDLITSSNENAKQMLMVFEEILKDYPAETEIENTKTCEGCYELMKKEAKEKAVNGSYCFGFKETKEFVIKYLNLYKKVEEKIIEFEDFI